jgi:hypothetical protein
MVEATAAKDSPTVDIWQGTSCLTRNSAFCICSQGAAAMADAERKFLAAIGKPQAKQTSVHNLAAELLSLHEVSGNHLHVRASVARWNCIESRLLSACRTRNRGIRETTSRLSGPWRWRRQC